VISPYIIVFVVIGFVIGLISRQEQNGDAYVWYILITIGWFFIWGPFAIFTFVELIVGDALARKIKGQESTVDKKILIQEISLMLTSLK